MIKQLFQVMRNMGARYTFYRGKLELEKKMGVLKLKHPINPEQKYFIGLTDWRKNDFAFIFPPREQFTIAKQKNSFLQIQANKILQGEILFFSIDWLKLGKQYDWITNPDNGYKYDIRKHWSEINDLDPKMGDIKYVWEKSRFSYILTIIRYDYHFSYDNSEFVFSEIENWIDSNPINQGPNWRCSQEISLRIFNWCFALSFYKNSTSLTEERWEKIQNVIYWSLDHVYTHIHFSRIAVRNNHAITETLFLALSNLLFPFIRKTIRWASRGRGWFEKEIEYQIYDDGTFLQYSMNYHRVVIQLLSLGFSLTELYSVPFSEIVYDRAYKSVNFLYQCLQKENGFLPNTGANDGSWFFPLSQTDYRDFRPQLNTLHFILTGKHLFNKLDVLEESFWLRSENIKNNNSYSVVEQNQGISNFPLGGYYIVRDNETFTMIRCSSYKDRPSHADNLHLDIWVNSENVLCDCGSYKYNTNEEFRNYFQGTSSHNSVMLDDYNQMLIGPRFIWYYWTQVSNVKIWETEKEYIFDGAIQAYKYLNKRIIHHRQVKKIKKENCWIISDEIINKPHSMSLRQIWHTDRKKILFETSASKVFEKNGWSSLYYGKKDRIIQVECCDISANIKTKIKI